MHKQCKICVIQKREYGSKNCKKQRNYCLKNPDKNKKYMSGKKEGRNEYERKKSKKALNFKVPHHMRIRTFKAVKSHFAKKN